VANFDEISMKLGEISSDIKHALAWMKDHELRDQERFDAMTEQINAHEPVIVEVKRFKWVVTGLAAFVALMVNAAASMLGLWRDW
jgi:hypothetical protein